MLVRSNKKIAPDGAMYVYPDEILKKCNLQGCYYISLDNVQKGDIITKRLWLIFQLGKMLLFIIIKENNAFHSLCKNDPQKVQIITKGISLTREVMFFF